MEEKSQKSGDLWSGLALAALGVYIVAEARQWDYLAPEGPGAGFFPLWYGVAMIVLSLALVYQGLSTRHISCTRFSSGCVCRCSIPHCLHFLLMRLCSQMPGPSHFLHCLL